MSNSSLVNVVRLSPNNSGTRTHKIDRITPHCVVGQLDAETIGNCFASRGIEASCNYGIGKDGRVVLVVDENKRSWCSSSSANDQRAVTIECASDMTAPYAFNSTVYNKLIVLCADICNRNGKNKLIWLADKNKALNYTPKSNEMLLTVHRWFANKSCPGDWLYSRLSDLATKVNAKLTSAGTNTSASTNTTYKVQAGAYNVKTNADAQVTKLKALGFNSFVVKENNIYKVQVGAFSVKANADNMIKNLKSKGIDAFIVGSTTKTVDEVAREVIKGLWGTGQDRINRLKKAGYNADAVQKRVNEILTK